MSLIQLSNGQILSMPGQLDSALANAKSQPKAKIMVSLDALLREICYVRNEWKEELSGSQKIVSDGNLGMVTIDMMCDEFYEILSRVSGYTVEDLNIPF